MARLTGSPTVQTLVVMGIVFVFQTLLEPFQFVYHTLFVLGPTFPVRPWSLVTSIYSHASLSHLLGNALVLLPVGLLVESFTSRIRYHAYFILTGIVAGLAQVMLTGHGVLGASAAIFALLGYLVAGNPVSSSVLDSLKLGRRAQLAAFAVLAVVVTFVTGAPGVALVAHFAGLLLGLVGGRLGVLGTTDSRRRTEVTNRPPGY